MNKLCTVMDYSRRRMGQFALLSVFAIAATAVLRSDLRAQEVPGALYRYDADLEPRWSTPEGRNGLKGRAGLENHGAKGHPCDIIKAGETCVLLDAKGPGVISRIWITISDRSPQMLRSLKLEMFWDDEKKPAVSVPLGDFFCVGLGRTATFHNALFASPEGRSFICCVPMPFRRAARIQVSNESGKDLSAIFFDVDYQKLKRWDADDLYLHAYWSRDRSTTLARDFELLPRVAGRGRFLGVNVGVDANPAYGDLWWGEGEVKIFLDGDIENPTFAGTGSEDYIGTGWGEEEFCDEFSGCLVADQKKAEWAFFRLHIPDAIFFNSDCRVTLQQIGGGPSEKVGALLKGKVPLIPVGIYKDGKFTKLYKVENGDRGGETSLPDGWENFYRSDDVSATAYFYLDSPSDGLPGLPPASERVLGLR